MQTHLDAVYEHEKNLANRIWLTQPMGGGVVQDLTWKDAMAQARRMATHLAAQGFPPGSRIAIFSKNCAWWLLADLAISMAGHVTVPIYPTLAADSIMQILEHSGSKLVFVGKLDGFSAMEPGIPQGMPRIGLPLSADKAAPRWDDLVAAAAPMEGSPRREPDDLATLIYTSGSTGEAKGVMHTFRTLAASRVFVEQFHFTVEDRAISYLPLAHVGERGLLEIPNFFVGFRLFFAESLDTFLTDIQRARPTIFGSVPRLWLKFQSGVLEKMPSKKLDMMLRIPLLGGVVKKKVLTGLGLESVRYAVCGSAPVPVDLLNWYGRLGLQIQEVYGMTENLAICHLTRPSTRRVGTVGLPMPGVEVKLTQEGEVLMKGPAVMTGYYNAPELTAQTLDKDGWLHTGDRGALDEAGHLRITGRVKEQFKTSKGKYVAPAPIENQLLASPLVEQACVMGAGASQPSALLVLSPGARNNDRAGLTENLSALMSHINGRIDPHERLERLVIIGEEWTIENGMLTPTLKLRRPGIEDRYSGQLAGWQERPETVLWA